MDMDMDVDMDMDMGIDVYHRPNLELACNVGSSLDPLRILEGVGQLYFDTMRGNVMYSKFCFPYSSKNLR